MIEPLVAQLRELAKSLPRAGCDWETPPSFAPPSSPDAVDELERAAGFRLPDDLRAFFALTDAVVGMSVHNGYQIGPLERVAHHVESGELPRQTPEGVAITVAFDGGGNAFLLSASGRVWRWDHETGNMSAVAVSFAAFLERVVADWTAYVNDTPGWMFLV